MIKIYIKNDEIYTKPLEYIFSVLSINKSHPIVFENNRLEANLIFDHTDSNSLPINMPFYEKLVVRQIFNHESYFDDVPFIKFQDGTIDNLSTAFYLINSFQEYNVDVNNEYNYDRLGRFQYKGSLQNKFNCIEENLVQKCFDQFCSMHSVLNPLNKIVKPTKIFLSHDIDKIYDSLNQDGGWALKKGRLDIYLKLIFNEILKRPDWKNIDKIVKLESEYDVKSCFFWLATQQMGSNKIKNADYSIRKEEKLTKIALINGLHKSCYDYSIDEELKILPFQTSYNRYHYLKITVPESWDEIEKSSLNFDASLGFAERYGFRNNYGMPFKPYNLKEKRSYNFIEVPLNIMDATFMGYMNVPVTQTSSRIIDFIEKNKTNSFISILWHNNYFSKYLYNGYLNEYKKVLIYMVEEKLKSITPEEIINEYQNG